MDEEYLELECGCTILNGNLFGHCTYHSISQPVVGDPLHRWLIETGKWEIDDAYEKDEEEIDEEETDSW